MLGPHDAEGRVGELSGDVVGQDRGAQPEVEEPGAGDLHRLAEVVDVEPLDEVGCYRARRLLLRLGEAESDVRLEVPELRAGRRTQLRLDPGDGLHPGAELGGEGSHDQAFSHSGRADPTTTVGQHGPRAAAAPTVPARPRQPGRRTHPGVVGDRRAGGAPVRRRGRGARAAARRRPRGERHRGQRRRRPRGGGGAPAPPGRQRRLHLAAAPPRRAVRDDRRPARPAGPDTQPRAGAPGRGAGGGFGAGRHRRGRDRRTADPGRHPDGARPGRRAAGGRRGRGGRRARLDLGRHRRRDHRSRGRVARGGGPRHPALDGVGPRARVRHRALVGRHGRPRTGRGRRAPGPRHRHPPARPRPGPSAGRVAGTFRGRPDQPHHGAARQPRRRVLRGGRALVLHALRSRQPLGGAPGPAARPRRRPRDPAHARPPPGPVRGPADRGAAGQDPARAAAQRLRARRHVATPALLRHRRRDPAVDLPAARRLAGGARRRRRG